MTKRIASAGMIAMVLTLTACGTEGWDSTHEKHFTTKVITVDDREVKCLIYQNGHAAGLSCDWEAAR